ncbi:iron(III) transport system permease protein [Arthrobacter pascens]|uniref:ABC transporter permease n=1 Tax=Arthrobacter pascens TaxID=1677 RepID=UPI0027843617|nr:iron ABC transporter permease [Arthrobacter pascens]MDQ0633092.1 iron(III) transport system permease protein [Arthrobacter pascens]
MSIKTPLATPAIAAGERNTGPARHRRTKALAKLRKSTPATIIIAILSVLVLLPLALVLLAAFSDAVPRPGNISLGGLTFDNLVLLATPEALGALGNSLMVGAGSAVVALIIGAFLAFVCARTDAPMRKFIFFIGMAPMFIPALVGALAWSLLSSPSAGYLNILLRDLGLDFIINIYSLPGLIFVLGIFYAPYAFLLMHSSLSMMNADLEEAATVHGATLKTMLRTVTLPLALPAVLGSAILVFALTMENFPVAQVIGNPAGIDTLPTYIYRLMNATPAKSNQAASIAIVLTAALLIITVVQQRIINKRKFTTVTGKGNRPRQVPLRKLRWPFTIIALAYFAVAVILPMLALLTASMQATPFVASIPQLFETGALSFSKLGDVLNSHDFQLALRNSVLVAIFAAAAGTTLSFVASYVRYRTKSRGGQLIELIAMTPLAVPAIVMGIGLLWTWLLLPVPVYGTLAILAIACVAVFLPQGYRGISASMLQMDQDLEDSAVMLGARRAKAIISVTLPLMRVGITSSFLLFLMLSMRELSASIFLFTSNTRILSILVFDNFDNGQSQAAAAVSVLYIVVIAVLAVIAQKVGANRKLATIK